MTAIRSYSHIRNNKVYLKGELLYDNADKDLKSFLKSAYRHFQVKYAKFFKMDEISKLGFLAAEVLIRDISRSAFQDEEVGIVLSNRNSTLETDSIHQQSITDPGNYYPSPSVFVYTLPNIMTGEISIRHKFRGENAFFIFEHFNPGFLTGYINQLFDQKKLKACIGGWVDQSADNYEAFLYWIEENNRGEAIQHTQNEVKKLHEIY
jgi:hypothetical protein